jgi:hypothetical protein
MCVVVTFFPLFGNVFVFSVIIFINNTVVLVKHIMFT